MSPRPAPDLTARRDRVLGHTRRIAEAEGWDAVTIRRLATELGVTQPVLYTAFGKRQDIVDAVALRGFAELAAALDAGDPAAAYLNFAHAHPATYEAMFLMPTGLRFATADVPAPMRGGVHRPGPRPRDRGRRPHRDRLEPPARGGLTRSRGSAVGRRAWPSFGGAGAAPRRPHHRRFSRHLRLSHLRPIAHPGLRELLDHRVPPVFAASGRQDLNPRPLDVMKERGLGKRLDTTRAPTQLRLTAVRQRSTRRADLPACRPQRHHRHRAHLSQAVPPRPRRRRDRHGPHLQASAGVVTHSVLQRRFGVSGGLSPERPGHTVPVPAADRGVASPCWRSRHRPKPSTARPWP